GLSDVGAELRTGLAVVAAGTSKSWLEEQSRSAGGVSLLAGGPGQVRERLFRELLVQRCRRLRQELEHSFAKSVAHEKVGLGVAELVVPVRGVRRLLRRPDEVVRRDEQHVPLEIGPVSGRRLGLPQGRPLARRLNPRTG